ncbi:MAG: radical SAM protein [Desulfurococcales archaeon]|nr:radical SAM protein [Desulfurococcales archaeon]
MIGLIYPSTRQVAFSSLFYRGIRNKLIDEGIYHGSYYLERGEVISDSKRGLTRAKALFISLPYEIMYRDYAELLLKLGINPRTREQLEDTIIVAGGPAVTANPAPIIDLVDAVIIGEIDDIFDDIIDILTGEGTKHSRLRKLAETSGVLALRYSSIPVRRHYVRDLNTYNIFLDQKLPDNIEPVWGKSYIVEASRGCGRGCRFCMEGFIFRPKRDRSYDTLRALVDEGVRQGFDKVSFYSLSFFDNPAAERILEYAIGHGLNTSVPSVRADTLTDKRIRLIADGGQRTLTVAPETGSCRMCKAINKVISKDLVIDVAEKALSSGIRSVKLYLITGFPHETEEDYNQTIELVKAMAQVHKRYGARLKVSLNPFIPKPVTPLQWAPLEDLKTLRSRIKELRKVAGRLGNVEVSAYDPRWAVAQTVLARGGREISALVVEWARRGSGLGHFRGALKTVSLDTSQYTQPLPENEVPIWHKLVEHPYASIDVLKREYRFYKMMFS